MKFLALIVAAALNPLVVRAPEPQGNLPADCEFSDRAPVRVQVADAGTGTRISVDDDPAAPLPPVRPTPITTTATTTTTPPAARPTDELQRALAGNDRAAYDAALARARQAGAQTRVYEDIGRLWDAQFESPFFAEGSEPHRIASGYRGYEEAMRREVFTDARGRKFYPAAESRAFVARQVGVTALGPLPAPQRTTTTTRRASADETPSRRATTPPLAGPRRTTTTASATQPKKSSSTSQGPRTRMPVARRSSAASEASAHPIPSAPPRTAATEPAPVVPPAVETTEAPPAAGSTATDFAATPDTAVTTTTAPAPSAPSESETATATAAPAEVPATPTTSKGRSVILPAILILIGLGVLILLFRTAR